MTIYNGDQNIVSIFNSSEFFIKTPMIKELEKQLNGWLWNGITGAIILGQYRIGKTTALLHLSKSLKNRLMQTLPVKVLTIKPRDKATITSIFKNLCFSLNIELKTRATSDDMANLLINYFAELALTNDTKQVVLIVDEMQRLSVKQLNAFAELFDTLNEFKINLTVFFTGNYEDSKPLISTVLDGNNDLIRGRFFTQSVMYYGIREHSEVKSCLSAYDQLSITKIYLSKHFEDGFRLESISHLIWEVFSEDYKKTLKIDSWGMQFFTAMMRVLIHDYMPVYGVSNDDELRQMIDRSIEASGLIPKLVSLK